MCIQLDRVQLKQNEFEISIIGRSYISMRSPINTPNQAKIYYTGFLVIHEDIICKLH
jgi:predicted nucleotide-binding protein (sugar kinase/HSP70/actin superfamily)